MRRGGARIAGRSEMIGSWWHHKSHADGRRRELYREMERERTAREYRGGASSLVVDHWIMELWAGAAGISVVALLLMELL
jgi:hypothetical protein